MDDLHFLFSFYKVKFLNLCKKLTYRTQIFLTKSILKLEMRKKGKLSLLLHLYS